MKLEEFSLALNALLPGCDPEAASNWAKFAAECVEQEEYAYFVYLEEHTTDAVEKWLDATYAGLYAVMREHGPEIAVKVADLSCYPCALYPGEMMQAAEVLKNGGDADEINRMIDDSELEAKEPFFFDLPDGGALTLQGPESKIFSRFGISCSLVQAEGEPGYELLDGGTVLLESKRDSFGRYLGGVEKDGTFLPTGRLYAPLCSEKGDVRAFQEVKPVTALEREAAFLAGEGNAIAIYRMKATPPSKDSVPLDQLQKSGESPIKGNYDLIHVFPLGPDDTSGTAVNICWSVIETGDIAAVKQEGAVMCWHVDKHEDIFHSDYSELPGLLENCGREVHKRSVLENLRQCQKEAGKSQDSTAPPTPRHDPER